MSIAPLRTVVVRALEPRDWPAVLFAENTASIALHHGAGYRTIGVRERIARLHGVWHDTVFIERRAPTP